MNSDSALKARRGCSPYTPEELERYRHQLEGQQAVLLRHLGGFTSSGLRPSVDSSGRSSDAGRLAEFASETFEQELSLDLLARAQGDLREIAEALERIDNRSYGLCNDCGLKIAEARLEALPAAEFCIGCKSRLEG